MNIFDMAKKYYPRLWSLERLQALEDAGKLSAEELERLVSQATDETTEMGDEA